MLRSPSEPLAKEVKSKRKHRESGKPGAKHHCAKLFPRKEPREEKDPLLCLECHQSDQALKVVAVRRGDWDGSDPSIRAVTLTEISTVGSMASSFSARGTMTLLHTS